jgi:2-keto-4-pentenoate hydratase/2-oxohepta-3-ene-1,7-dioic acid hydratase in catechol pathway
MRIAMKTLSLRVVGQGDARPLEFTVKKMVNAGYVGRDKKAVLAHIEELRREGVPAPPSVPMIFPVLSYNITTSGGVEVLGQKTSGEAEYVLLVDRGKVLVGVGSDHTDRELETYSIIQSKQVCNNVLSSEVWDFDDVKDVWDELQLESWVRQAGSDKEILYQSASLASILSAGEILDLVRSRLTEELTDGLVIYSGTVPVLSEQMIYGDHFRCELRNPAGGRSLRCEYDVHVLDYLKG